MTKAQRKTQVQIGKLRLALNHEDRDLHLANLRAILSELERGYGYQGRAALSWRDRARLVIAHYELAAA